MPVVGANTFDDGVFDLCIAAILRMPYPSLRCSLMIGSIFRKTLGTALGTAINFLPVDPIRALYWSAVINGVMVAPIIVVMMSLASNPRVMGHFTLSLWLKIVGWITAVVMALCVVSWLCSKYQCRTSTYLSPAARR